MQRWISTGSRLWNAKAVGNTKRGPPTTAQTTTSALAELDTKIISHFCALNGNTIGPHKKNSFFFSSKAFHSMLERINHIGPYFCTVSFGFDILCFRLRAYGGLL